MGVGIVTHGVAPHAHAHPGTVQATMHPNAVNVQPGAAQAHMHPIAVNTNFTATTDVPVKVFGNYNIL